jgi:hypothetical protein
LFGKFGIAYDTTAPIFDALPGSNPVTIEVGQPYIDDGATANDNYDDSVAAPIPDLSNVNVNTVGDYLVIYTAKDIANNIATTSRTVKVVDTTAPVITLLGNSTVDIELGSAYTDAGATSTDNYNGDLTSSIATISTVDINTIGVYTVTYNVSDSSGNAAVQVVRTVNVIPVPTPPTPPATTSSSSSSGGSVLITQPKQPEVKNTEENIIIPEEQVEVLGVESDYRAIQLNKILSEAEIVVSGDVSLILANTGKTRDLALESDGYKKYISLLIAGAQLTEISINAITNFIVYGTETTQKLGAGERAGVINSYKSAFGKLPTTQSDWEDVIKIANGRWPSERSEGAENKAKAEFKKVYLRDANMDNANDNAAVTIMAYGLRPDNRNLDSEKAAIKIFKAIYKYNPTSAINWDTVRAIAYSGAKR